MLLQQRQRRKPCKSCPWYGRTPAQATRVAMAREIGGAIILNPRPSSLMLIPIITESMLIPCRQCECWANVAGYCTCRPAKGARLPAASSHKTSKGKHHLWHSGHIFILIDKSLDHIGRRGRSDVVVFWQWYMYVMSKKRAAASILAIICIEFKNVYFVLVTNNHPSSIWLGHNIQMEF